jgi:hypothetical protein
MAARHICEDLVSFEIDFASSEEVEGHENFNVKRYRRA